MKRLHLVMALVVSLMAWAQLPAQASPLTLATAVRALAFFVGDSITAGLYLPASQDYTARVARGLGDDASMLAGNGMQTQWALDNLRGAPTLGIDAQIIVVALGTNDLGLGTAHESVSQWIPTYTRLLTLLAQRAPLATLVCVTPWHTSDALAASYDAALTAMCHQAGGHVADISRLYDDVRNQDRFTLHHPNARGQALIAAAVLRAAQGCDSLAQPSEPRCVPLGHLPMWAV